MMLGSLTPVTYMIGTSIYVVLAGFCGAAIIALIIDLTAGAGHAASTWYAALWSMTNLPGAYMQWADGQAYKHFGPRGMLAVDALSNVVPALLFLAYLQRSSAPQKRMIEAAAEGADILK